MTDWERLRELICVRAVRRSDAPFKLSSGKLSRLYIDLDQILYEKFGFQLVSKLAGETIEKMGKYELDAVGGPVQGATQLAAAILAHAGTKGFPLRTFGVRKESKEYGLKEQVFGALRYGDRVILCEDLVTTGTSVRKAWDAVVEFGGQVCGVLAIVDRGASKKLFPMPLVALYTMEDLELENEFA